ncbi:MAG: hypothetical protein AAF802_04905 [Planctomycetota bacterium]
MAKANERAGWRKSKTRPVAASTGEFGQRGREKRKLLFRVSMFATFAVALVVMLSIELLQRPDLDVPLILSVVSKSDVRTATDPLYTAPNPYASEDVDLLRGWFGGGPDDPSQNVRVVGDDADASGAMGFETGRLISAITRPLETAKPGGPGGDVIAVYLSACGFVDAGVPYLAVGDSRADRRGSWVKLQDVLDEIKTTLKNRDDGASVRVVMFIDAARVGPQWQWGVFSSTFADACRKLVSGPSEKLAIVLSARPGERSWWDPRKGHGLFPEALVQALTGRGDQDGDGIVTVDEIATHLRNQVSRNAEAIWDARQTPWLVNADAGSWQFISQPKPDREPSFEPVDIDLIASDFESNDTLWERHNALTREFHTPLAFDPLGWASLESKLSRLDALVLSGKGYRGEYVALRNECESDLSEFERGPKSLPSPNSLSELAIQDYFFEPPELSPEFAEMVEAWRKKPAIDAVQLPLTERSTIGFLWPWLQENGFDPKKTAVAAELLDQKRLVTREQAPLLLESFWTRFFSAPDLSSISTSTISVLVEAQTASRKAICAGDLRALFWIRQRLASVDQSRREAVDRMLSRNPDDRAAGLDQWRRSISPELGSLTEKAKRLSEAYQLRDQMLHSIPRLSETLLHDVEAFDSYEQLPDVRSQKLIATATAELSKLVVALRLPASDDPRPIEELEEDVFSAEKAARAAFEALTRRITDRQGEAIGSKAEDARGLRQTLALLTGSGTDDHSDRMRVHNKIVETLRQTSPALGAVNADLEPESAAVAAERLEWSAIDGQHVWGAWLNKTRTAERGFQPSSEGTSDSGPAISPEDLLAAIEKSGATVRERAETLQSGKMGEKLTATELLQIPIGKVGQGESLESIRRELATWDTQLRARTFLFSHSPQAVRRIGEGRFALDQQLFFYEHASRVMDEFWCQARGGDPPYFASAAGRLLATRHQNALFSKLTPNVDGIDLTKRLAELNRLANARTTLSPRPTAENEAGTLLKFVAGENVDFLVDQSPTVPAGFASFWGRYGDDKKTIRIGGGSEEQLVALSVPKDIPAEADAVVAGLFFRGLRRQGEVILNRLEGGKRTVFRLPEYDAPAARVDRDRTEPERLLVVMDCSKSMVLYPTSDPIKRLDVAKDAMIQFLQNLQGNYEVGLIVFGDRFGFKESSGNVEMEDGKIRVLQRLENREVDAGLLLGNEDVNHNPNLDVRQPLPINALNFNQRRSLLDEIKSLGGIGTTPTYRALLEAYEHLGNRSGHVILLTDGTPKVITVKGANIDDREAAAKRIVDSRRDDVHLTIVKYQYRETDLEEDFPSATVLTAATGPELLKHLESVRSQPEIRWDRNRLPASEIGEFGDRVAVAQWPPEGVGIPSGQPVVPAEPYSVRVRVSSFDQTVNEAAEVSVEGGEEFSLLLSDGNLTHQAFDYQFAAMKKINSRGADSSRYIVHLGPKAERQNRQLTMQLAIERSSGGLSSGDFTPRPSDVWIELTGIQGDGGTRRSNQTFIFSLPEFETRQPIPILLSRIDNFPERFDTIEAKAWFRFASSPLSGIEIPVGTAEPFTHEQLPGVSFRTERSANESAGIRLTVTEQYSGDRNPGTLRVLPSPLPNRASTVVYEDKRVIVRTFDFDDAETSLSLSVCDHELIKSNASLKAEGVVPLVFD